MGEFCFVFLLWKPTKSWQTFVIFHALTYVKKQTFPCQRVCVYVSNGEWAAQQDNYWLFLSHLLALMYWFMLNLWKGLCTQMPPPPPPALWTASSPGLCGRSALSSFVGLVLHQFCSPLRRRSGWLPVGHALMLSSRVGSLVSNVSGAPPPPLPCHLEADWKPIHNLSLME